MDAALALGLRHPLDPMDPAFELQPGIGPPAGDGEDHLLDAAHLGPIVLHELHGVPVPLGVPLVHPEQVPAEEGGLLPAGAGPDLQDHVLVVVGVLRQEQQLQLLRELLLGGLQLLQLALGQLLHVRLQMLVEHLPAVRLLGKIPFVPVDDRHDLLELDPLPVHLLPGGHVPHGVRGGQQPSQLLVPCLQFVQFLSHILSTQATRSRPPISFTILAPGNSPWTASPWVWPISSSSNPPGRTCFPHSAASRR